jgi:hypothetical protein
MLNTDRVTRRMIKGSAVGKTKRSAEGGGDDSFCQDTVRP